MTTLVTSDEKREVKHKIINMKVIGKLQPDVKLDTSSTLFKIYEPPTFVPVWFSRWWAVHNRKTDVMRISLLYEEVLKLLEDKTLDPTTKSQLITTLKDSITGLHNLKSTYQEDATCVSSIEYVIERIGVKITTK
tara:strand:- start:627 stop:1031 length:405 start_codon:yes stop_codon:yes gene_type:complete